MIIKTSNNIQDLTGIGEEWLMDSEGFILFMFYNGNIMTGNAYQGDNERTK